MRILLAALALFAAGAARAELDPAVQREVWEAEDAFVELQTGQLNAMVRFAEALHGHLAQPRPDLAHALERSRDARAKLVACGMLIPGSDGSYAFAKTEPTPDFLHYRVVVLSMVHQTKDLVQGLVRTRLNGTFDGLPEGLKKAYLDFKAFDEQYVPKSDPLNARLTRAQSEGYLSRWGLW